ncbi:helix-turn-helix domain-containing protein [Mesorhizobium sp.]|uniref:helix-turn-helix domain-containing protein n=1 Tax=Mesorhizobium sp. TaxID=1871066 RepID=UPI00121E6FDA|nr:MAG: helix-turn-helix domain-containing protein [Mesorhizobium sp.]TIQ54351.1 MAG: helix-turn-helix domain-containing protein [Mesorhizobium sp.]
MSANQTPLGDSSQRWVPPGRPDLVSIEELAAILGVSVRTVRRYQAAGLTPTRIRRSRQMMYRRLDVENWIKGAARSGS